MNTFQLVILLLVFLGATQGIFLGGILWGQKRGNNIANRVLAVLLLVVAVLTSNFVFCRSGAVYDYPYLANLDVPLMFLGAPLLFLYVRALTKPGFRLHWKHLLHLVPFLACTVYLFPYFLEDAEVRLRGGDVNWVLLHALLCVQLLAYLIGIFVLLRSHVAQIKDLFSSRQRVDLRWLRNLALAVVLLWVFVGLVLVVGDYGGPLAYVAPVILSFIVYAIGYLGFRQPEIFSGPLASLDAGSGQERYATSSLTDVQAKKYLEKLLRHMDEEQPYLSPDLTLPDLADQLTMPLHHLSQLINQRVGQNFFDFINGYRVEEAKRQLLDDSSAYLTILAMAQQAGFNSKSAFYAAFRKHAGTTPSRFRNEAIDRLATSAEA